ncbi:hypothetical protein RN001_005573 [Aquatica leii]|uniref:DUF4806 domain-containing protein n=1 Tax=Aquatica leii TaxID=1421715 RepID=A0AAN7SIY5_9COLE|nr:hypothetical protein RN001_005573 [Aquatica leii]
MWNLYQMYLVHKLWGAVTVKKTDDPVLEISKIGGCNVPEFIKRVLPKILSNEVASCYSWFGLKKKKIFGKLLLSQVIIRAGLHIFQTETSKSIEEAIKNWLRRAKERIEKK